MSLARKITAVSVCITTRCSRKCPDCCCKHDELWDADLWYLKWIFGTFGRDSAWIERVHLTGGEPLEVPGLSDIVLSFIGVDSSYLTNVPLLTIETARFDPVLRFFDMIYFSDYGVDSKARGATIALGQEKGVKVHVGKIKHLPDVPGPGGMCDRGRSELIAVYKDRVFPCCVGPGIPGAESIPVSPDAREKILSVPMPCDRCRFSV